MIASLPIEITEDIIELNLPIPYYRNLVERQETLLLYSQVSSIWRAISQRKLLQQLYIDDSEGRVEKLEVFLKFPRDFSTIQSLYLDLYAHENLKEMSVEVHNFLESCTQLKELWLVGFKFVKFELKDRMWWDNMSKLTALHLVHCDISSFDSKDFEVSPFLHLNHLTMQNLKYQGSESLAFLRPTIFPSLTSLSYINLSTTCKYITTALVLSPSLASQITKIIYCNTWSSMRDRIFVTEQLPILINLSTLIFTGTLLSKIPGFRLPPKLNSLALLFPHQTYPECLEDPTEWIEETIASDVGRLLYSSYDQKTNLNFKSELMLGIWEQIYRDLKILIVLEDSGVLWEDRSGVDHFDWRLCCDFFKELNRFLPYNTISNLS